MKALVALKAPKALPAPTKEDHLSAPKEEESKTMTYAEALKAFPEMDKLQEGDMKDALEKIGGENNWE